MLSKIKLSYLPNYHIPHYSIYQILHEILIDPLGDVSRANVLSDVCNFCCSKTLAIKM